MTKLSNIPNSNHYAILTEKTVYTPEDERSRTNPGHGYSSRTDYFINYEVFENKEAWESKIKSLTLNKEKFRAIEVFPAQIETTINVSVKKGGV